MRRNEAAGNDLETKDGQSHQSEVEDQGDYRESNDPADKPGIAVCNLLEGPIKPAEKPANRMIEQAVSPGALFDLVLRRRRPQRAGLNRE